MNTRETIVFLGTVVASLLLAVYLPLIVPSAITA